jgi:hypothetical protein
MRDLTNRARISRRKARHSIARPQDETGKVRPLSALEEEGRDLDELTSFVCNNLDQPVSRIASLVEEEFGIQLGREHPYELVRRAASAGRLSYDSPIDSRLSHELLEGHDWLKRTRVVRTRLATDVASHAARLLLDLAVKWEEPDLHIGFGGGGLMAETVRLWAGFLKFRKDIKFKQLFVHTLVAASYDPRRSPNGFVRWLLDLSLPFKTIFYGLPTPAFLSPPALKALREMEGVRDVFKEARKLDVVVTSAGAHWEDDHSGLSWQLGEISEDSVTALKKAGCIGDVLWQPFGPGGPIDAKVDLRAVTLLNLNDLPPLVREGKRVMLVMAPCGHASCGRPKDAMLRAVLGWRNAISDLVVDAGAASSVLGAHPQVP